MIATASHDGIAEHTASEIHPWPQHALSEDPRSTGLRVEALQAAMDVLVLVRPAERVKSIEAVARPCSGANLNHVRAQGLPLPGARVVPLHRPQPRAAGAAQDPHSATVRRGRCSRPRDRHGLQGHPALHPRVERLHVAKEALAVIPADREDAAVKLRRRAVSPRHVEVRALHPRPTQGVEALRLNEGRVFEVLPTEQVRSRVQHLRTEVLPFGLHRPDRPPALVLDVQHLRGGEVLRPVVAAHGVDERVRVEADAEVLRLLAQRVRLRRVPGRRRLRGLAQEVDDRAEEARVAVQKDAAIAVTWCLRSARHQPLEQATWLLGVGLPR
mmetsp:Transcript_100685/g.285330  ORF Transcript_100685/g.285330 Transcript_100685/m.285330 type:complete len:328 (-) Transcript_100685:705-1688(-)